MAASRPAGGAADRGDPGPERTLRRGSHTRQLALRCRQRRTFLDTGRNGSPVVCGPDGVAIFDALNRRGAVTEAMLYAFDLLELDGEDLRDMPLGDRKKRLARLLGERCPPQRWQQAGVVQ